MNFATSNVFLFVSLGNNSIQYNATKVEQFVPRCLRRNFSFGAHLYQAALFISTTVWEFVRTTKAIRSSKNIEDFQSAWYSLLLPFMSREIHSLDFFLN